MNKTRILLALVLLLSLGVRVYYLFWTWDQPVWWDEANYLVKAKSLALGTADTGYDSGRPILFSLTMAPFFSLGLGEGAIRLALGLLSLLSVFLLYKIGDRLLGPEVGVVGAALFSGHYLNLFYTQRIMCEVPYVTLALLGIDLLLSDRPRWVWAAGPVLALSVLMRYPAFVIPLCLLVYVLLTQGKQALVRRDYQVSAALALVTVMPDLALRGAQTFGAVSWMLAPRTLEERLGGLGEAIRLFYTVQNPIFGWALLAALGLACYYLFTWRSRAPKPARAHLLLMLWLLGPIFVQGFCISHFEVRYLYASQASACLLVGSLCWHLVHSSPSSKRRLSVGLTTVLVVATWAMSWRTSHLLILDKLDSFRGLQVAGEWLKAQNESGAVVSKNVAQLTYYSEMPNLNLPDARNDFAKLLQQRQPRYVVVSALEPHPDWVYTLNPDEFGLRVVMSYPQQKPQVIVLEVVSAAH